MSQKESSSELEKFGVVYKRWVTLSVAEGKPEDKGLVRIDKETMKALRVKPGEQIWVAKSLDFREGAVIGNAAEAFPEDEEKKIVRLSKDLLAKGKDPSINIRVGDRVFLERLKGGVPSI